MRLLQLNCLGLEACLGEDILPGTASNREKVGNHRLDGGMASELCPDIIPALQQGKLAGDPHN
eukprot:8432842-Heterocapsa_arctica.AAC.1